MLLTQLAAVAQTDTIRRKSIDSDTVKIVVVNNFNPIISDAVKLNYPPKEPVIKREKSPVKYNVPVTLAPIVYPPINIRPLAINKEKPVEYPGAYLKLGFGTQFSPLGELFYSGHKLNGDNEVFNYGVFFHHLSAFGQKIKNQNFMDNQAAAYINFYPAQKVRIGTRFDFENNSVYYYGYNHADTSFSKKEIKQTYNWLNLDVNLANAKPTKIGLDHDSHIKLYGIYDKYSQHDIGADLYTDLKVVFKQKHEVYLHAEDFYSNFANKAGASNNNLLDIKPGYQYNGGAWKIHGAFGIIMDNGTFRPGPDLGAQWAVVHDYLVVYGGWLMDVRKLTYRDLAQRNPWIEDNTFGLLNTRFEDRFVGLKGTVAKGLTYDLQFAQRVMREMPLFINDSLDTKKFLVVYNPGTLKFFDLRWGLEYRVNSDLNFEFKGDFNVYNPEFEQKAWSLPVMTATFTANYKIAEKIFLKLDVIGIGKSYAKLADNQTQKVNGTVDLNLGATYKFSKYFSFFAELNNLANIKYQQYYNYPSYGFNGKLGVIFTYQK